MSAGFLINAKNKEKNQTFSKLLVRQLWRPRAYFSTRLPGGFFISFRLARREGSTTKKSEFDLSVFLITFYFNELGQERLQALY